jgi:methylmalonyl-CoA mutase
MDQGAIPKPDKKLFEEFPPVKSEEWETVINNDLKGQDYQERLIWKTGEGFNVKPYYRHEDLETLEHLNSFPGEFPFVRSNKENNNAWNIRQDLSVDDPIGASEKAIDLINKGVTSLGLIFNEENNYPIIAIENLVKSVLAADVELNIYSGRNSLNSLKIIDKLVQEDHFNNTIVTGSINFDPLGHLTLRGCYYTSEKEDFDMCRKLIEAAEDLPSLRLIEIAGNHFHNSGASIVEELAFSLSEGVEYIHQLTDRSLIIDKISPRLTFTFATGANYFLEIAKLRAARLLWANIVKACKSGNDNLSRMHIVVTTSKWNMTLYDPYVNILRSTTESMSAIIGGADTLSIVPFDNPFGKVSDIAERIARNQQLVLMEESHLHKVIDPAAGSYYIETLTNLIAKKAWEKFTEIEAKGGFLKALKEGYIQSQIKETSLQREIAISRRREILLGTNQYPDFTEHIEAELPSEFFEPGNRKARDTTIETLKPYRGAMAFDRLRYRTDKYSKTHDRPAVFMLTYGNLAMRRARSQFAGNFFGCAGFEIIDNPGFDTVHEGIQTGLGSHAKIVVICSSDEEYKDSVPEILRRLKDHKIVVLAGYPRENAERFKAMGLNHFIHLKSNILETLEGFQKELKMF